MRKYFANFDLWLYVIPILLSLVGIAVIYSLVYAKDTDNLVLKQAVSMGIGIAAMIALTIYDYRHLKNIVWPLYIVSVVLLLIVDYFGHTAGGATRWLSLGPIQIQPSEILKVTSIIFWASYFSDKIGEIRWKDILFLLFFFSVPLYLVLKQPDLGTALVIIFMIILTLFWLKFSRKQYIVLISALISIVIVFSMSVKNVSVFGKLLKSYQRDRIEVFLNPEKDVLGRGYNVKQAIIAVGSGGLTGHGLGQGSQSQLQFLPKAQTDFIFSGFAEAFGFVGSLALVAIYFFLLTRIIRIGNIAKDNFGLIIAIGCLGMFFFQVFVNIGMNIGLMPVTGIPLPFMSSGGSSLVVSFATLGILQSVAIRHKKIIF